MARFEAIDDPQFEPGQVWRYETRPGESASRLVVVRIERLFGDVVVHVQVYGLRFRNPRLPSGIQPSLWHVPMRRDSLVASVIEAVDAEPDTFHGEAFREGYEIWRTAVEEERSGFFTLPVAQLVDALEGAYLRSLGEDEA